MTDGVADSTVGGPTPGTCPLCAALNSPEATRCGACNFHLVDVDSVRPNRRQTFTIVMVGAGCWLVALVSVLLAR